MLASGWPRLRTVVVSVVAWPVMRAGAAGFTAVLLGTTAVCWAASRLAGRREKRVERQWMTGLSDIR